jgi:hypothetical protein
VERLFQITRLAKTPGSKNLGIGPNRHHTKYFFGINFGQDLTPAVGAQKWPFLGKVAPLFYRTPANCCIFGFSQWISPVVETKKKQLFDEWKSVVKNSWS